MRDESRGLNTFQITVAESLRHRVSVGLSSDRLAAGEVRRGQEGLLITVAGLWSGSWLLCSLCSSFKMATSARLPGQDTNCLQSSGGWRLLAVEESPRLDCGWLVWCSL